MINANELRIGNWVKCFDFNCRITHLGETVLGYQVEDNKTSATYKLIEPTLLTPEILLKCGFNKHGNSNEFWNFWILETGWHIGEALHNEPSAGVKPGNCYWGETYVEIKFLHQLQNLYFSLTGKELEYNP